MKHILYLLIGAIAILGCTENSYSTELKDNFTKEEIRDLHKLTDFFLARMCNSTGNVKECLDSLIPHLLDNEWLPIQEHIDFEDQQALYNAFESNIFNEIWRFCKVRNPREGWERKALCLNTDGKYMAFLKDMGKRNGVLEAYKDDLLMSGDFFGIQRIEYDVYNKSDRIDLGDFGIQVLLAVEYLTHNDHQKREDLWVEE